MGTWGGYQPNAGRPPGRPNNETLERRKVEKALHQAIMAKANRLLKAMMLQAEGEFFLMRVDEEEGEKGKKKRVHNIVTDWREIKEFFNEHAQEITSQEEIGGLSGKVEDNYYYIKTIPADWRAIESLFDRVFGKSTQHISTDEGGSERDNYEQLNGEQLDRHIEELRARIAKVRDAKGEGTENTGTGESETKTEEP